MRPSWRVRETLYSSVLLHRASRVAYPHEIDGRRSFRSNGRHPKRDSLQVMIATVARPAPRPRFTYV